MLKVPATLVEGNEKELYKLSEEPQSSRPPPRRLINAALRCLPPVTEREARKLPILFSLLITVGSLGKRFSAFIHINNPRTEEAAVSYSSLTSTIQQFI